MPGEGTLVSAGQSCIGWSAKEIGVVTLMNKLQIIFCVFPAENNSVN